MKTIAVLGDSQTDYNVWYGVAAYRNHAPVLATALRAEGHSYRVRAFGVSGDTTALGLARVDALFRYDVPDIAVVYLGVNDASGSVPQATTQANMQAIIKAIKHRAIGDGLGGGGTVAGQANLPATGEAGQRYVVLADTSTNGGASAANASQATTITGAGGGAQTVWEYRYPLAGESGWGRIATASTTPSVVRKIIVVSTGYLNFTAGGDTPTVPHSGNATVRAALTAAVTAENVAVAGVASVVYADLYTLMKSRIQAGADPDFSAVAYDQAKSWHYTQNNQHHSAYGHALVAQSVRAAIPSGWLT